MWTVVPSRVERRTTPRDNAWAGKDRRREEEFRVVLERQWSRGWLAFETKGEKRRLAPYPQDWETMSSAELEALLAAATIVNPSKRLIE